jgi:hypothetical protein
MSRKAVKSFKELRKLRIGPTVQIERAGSHFKARHPGRSEFVFGTSPADARRNLRRMGPGSKKRYCKF